MADGLINRYGSLYFAIDSFPGCENAEVIGDAPQSLKDAIEARFVIGPVADRAFWLNERARMDLDRGPCQYISLFPDDCDRANGNARETS